MDDLDPSVLFRDLAMARAIVLAVSGGSDSTALMHLAALWAPNGEKPPILVASVDHGLRPGSRAIAESVVAAARALDLDASVLTWKGEKPTRAVQERARAARYALLEAFARDRQASYLVTAHTLDDQAETMLFRMARGSSLAGLAGMAPTTPLDDLILARPLLSVPKAALMERCRRERWDFVDDPANSDPRFARTRWRSLAPALAAEGLTAHRLGGLAQRLARAEMALRSSALAAEAACKAGHDAGRRRYRAAQLMSQPAEVILRVIGAAVTALGTSHALRLNRLERLTDEMQRGYLRGESLRRTLNGCLITLGQDGMIVICPERARCRGRSNQSSLP